MMLNVPLIPLIAPEAPEGSKWERNLPPPPHVSQPAMLPIASVSFTFTVHHVVFVYCQVMELTPDEQEWLDEWRKNAPR